LSFTNHNMKHLIRQLRVPVVQNLTMHFRRCARTLSSFDNKTVSRSLYQRYDTGFHHKSYGFNPFFNTKMYQFGSNATEDVVVPNLGDSVLEGTIRTIHKKVGDEVHMDEVVLDIETDKVTVDVRAPKDGAITKFHKQSKNDVRVGDLLFSISSSSSSSSSTPKSTADSSKKQSTTSSSSTSEPTAKSASKPPPPVSAPKNTDTNQHESKPSNTSTSKHRTPMIHFRYGKRTEETKKDESLKSSSSSSSSDSSRNKSDIQFEELPLKFQNRMWTQLDIEIINSGGADLWDLKQLLKPKSKGKANQVKNKIK